MLYLYNLRLFSILMEGSRGLKLTPQQYCRSRLSYSSLPPHLTINKAYIDKARYTKAKSQRISSYLSCDRSNPKFQLFCVAITVKAIE